MSQLATFSVHGLALGVDVLEVQEILRDQSLTRVPLACEDVAGLINLRGQIVPALSLEKLLRLPSGGTEPARVSLVVTSAAGPISLQADDVGDVIEVTPDTFELPPRNLDAAVRDLIDGVHKLDGQLLLVLNIGRVLETQASEGKARSER